MTRAKPDRRIKRTQQSLHAALNELILEKGYEGITIQDITCRANVGRSTFYAHHGSKEGLLLSGLQHLRAALMAAQRDSLAPRGVSQAPALGFSRVFFEHVHEYRDIFQALAGDECGPVVTAKMKRIVADAIKDQLGSGAGKSRESKIPEELVVRFAVDALFSVLFWWLEQNPKLPPARVDAIYRQLVLPAFTQAGVR